MLLYIFTILNPSQQFTVLFFFLNWILQDNFLWFNSSLRLYETCIFFPVFEISRFLVEIAFVNAWFKPALFWRFAVYIFATVTLELTIIVLIKIANNTFIIVIKQPSPVIDIIVIHMAFKYQLLWYEDDEPIRLSIGMLSNEDTALPKEDLWNWM